MVYLVGQVIDCPQYEGNLPAAGHFPMGTGTAGCKGISFRPGCGGQEREVVWIPGWGARPGTGRVPSCRGQAVHAEALTALRLMPLGRSGMWNWRLPALSCYSRLIQAT